MGRAILAVVAGYFAMAIFVMAALTLSWILLGPSYTFREGTTQVTVGWLAFNLPFSLLGALLGGWTAAAVGRSPTNGPVKALAVLILVVGLATAVAHLYTDRPEATAPKPVAEMSSLEAASEAIQPRW